MPIHLLIPRLRRLAVLAVLAPAAGAADDSRLPDGIYAEILTPKGEITCELEYAKVPLTVANFVGLAEGSLGPNPGKPFFDGLTFHRVVPNFVVQGGDPLGTGEGGPGYTFADEFVPGLGHDSAGVLSMANDGPDTNGSQFFITLAPAERLNYLHSVFGRMVRGSDVLARIAQGDVMHVRILRLGAPAQAFKADRASFLALSARAPRYRAEKEPGPAAHFDDPDKLLPTDVPRAKNFNFKLANVERATGEKVYARLFARFVPSGPGGNPDAFAGSLFSSLALGDDGLLLVYFADQDRWHLSMGKTMSQRFAGQAGDSAPPNKNGPSAEKLSVFDEKMRTRAAKYAVQTALVLPNFLQIPGQRIKISTDAALDESLSQLMLYQVTTKSARLQ